MDFDNAFDPGIEDEYDDSWMDQYSLPEIFSIARETADLDYADQFMPTADAASNAVDVSPTGGRGSASAGANGSGSFPNEGGGSIFDGLETFTRDNKNLIGLGAAGLSAWAQTVSNNRNASQAEDAAWWKRAETAQDKRDAQLRADNKSDTDWEREKERTRIQNGFITTTNAQRQKDQLEIIAAQNAGRGSSSSGGGGGFDPAAARAARVSASIKNMKAPTAGIVNSNIWGNALNTLQKR